MKIPSYTEPGKIKSNPDRRYIILSIFKTNGKLSIQNVEDYFEEDRDKMMAGPCIERLRDEGLVAKAVHFYWITHAGLKYLREAIETGKYAG